MKGCFVSNGPRTKRGYVLSGANASARVPLHVTVIPRKHHEPSNRISLSV